VAPVRSILAVIVAGNILWTGSKLMRRSIGGLMDESDPKDGGRNPGDPATGDFPAPDQVHGLRHRNAGAKLMIEFHCFFPQNVSIAAAHERATMIEEEIHRRFPNPPKSFSHLEPIEAMMKIHRKILKGGQGRYRVLNTGWTFRDGSQLPGAHSTPLPFLLLSL